MSDNRKGGGYANTSRRAGGAIRARIAGRMTPEIFAETAQGQERFWEFFGGSIRNRSTRLAYVTAAYRLCGPCMWLATSSR